MSRKCTKLFMRLNVLPLLLLSLLSSIVKKHGFDIPDSALVAVAFQLAKSGMSSLLVCQVASTLNVDQNSNKLEAFSVRMILVPLLVKTPLSPSFVLSSEFGGIVHWIFVSLCQPSSESVAEVERKDCRLKLERPYLDGMTRPLKKCAHSLI